MFKKYINFIISAIIVGVYAVLMAKLVDFAFQLFQSYSKNLDFWLLIVIPLGSLFVNYLVRNYLKEADGGGIGPVLAVAKSSELDKLSYLLTFKMIVAKLIITPIGTFFGATIGREGPTIQASAAIFYMLNKTKDEIELKKITLIGAGAGLAAAFNTPLGGIVYVFEELIKSGYDKKTYFLILLGISLTSITSVYLVGNNTYFGRVDRGILNYEFQVFMLAIIVGISCGLLSVVFTKIVMYVTSSTTKIGIWRRQNPYKSALIGGFLIALCGIVTLGHSFGNGYIEMKAALSHETNLPEWYFLAKMAGSIFSQFAAIPGGYFSTSLSIGGGIGQLFHAYCSYINQEQFYLLGMVGFLAALTGAPITAVAMVLQVAFTQVFTLPLAICAFCAGAVAYSFDKESIYEKQARALY